MLLNRAENFSVFLFFCNWVAVFSVFLMVVKLYLKGKRIGPVPFVLIISALASKAGIGSSSTEETEQRWFTV